MASASTSPRTLRKAVLPVAGFGTRVLPATKAIPKELLPVFDRPAIQYVVDEALAAGIEHIVFVTGRNKGAIEDYFDRSYELEVTLQQKQKPEQLAEATLSVPVAGSMSFVRQQAALGLGHAVWCARDIIGDEPFAVMLPDEIMGDSSLLAQMCDVAAATGGSVVGLKHVPMGEVSAYGVIDPSGPLDDDGVISIRTMVEKPPMADAPSDLIIIGRYVLTPDVFDKIEAVQPGAGGEIQLTDALRVLAAEGPFHGVLRDIRRYDTGNPLGWLTAVVELALEDERIGADFRTWLQGRL